MKLSSIHIVLFIVILLTLTGVGTYLGKTATGAIVKNVTGKDIPESYYTTRNWFGQQFPDTRYQRGKELLRQ